MLERRRSRWIPEGSLRPRDRPAGRITASRCAASRFRSGCPVSAGPWPGRFRDELADQVKAPFLREEVHQLGQEGAPGLRPAGLPPGTLPAAGAIAAIHAYRLHLLDHPELAPQVLVLGDVEVTEPDGADTVDPVAARRLLPRGSKGGTQWLLSGIRMRPSGRQETRPVPAGSDPFGEQQPGERSSRPGDFLPCLLGQEFETLRRKRLAARRSSLFWRDGNRLGPIRSGRSSWDPGTRQPCPSTAMPGPQDRKSDGHHPSSEKAFHDHC